MNNISFVFLERSSAKKVGPIPATYTSRNSCWDGCKFLGNGCYAESGNVALVHMGHRTDVPRIGFEQLLEKISGIVTNQPWRHNIGGDLPGINSAIDRKMMHQLIMANHGEHKSRFARRGKKLGFTFTHKPVLDNSDNRTIIKEANEYGFRINLSGDNPRHADQLADLNIGPVVLALPREYMRKTKANTSSDFVEDLSIYKARVNTLPRHTPAGRKIAICPATFLPGVTCATCGACSRIRDAIIGFPAHGARFKTVDRIATA